MGKLAAYILFPLLTSFFILGLFFTLTDPSTWPQRKTHLMSTDMRVIPSLSTVWCESVILYSDMDFEVYKTKDFPKIDNHLTKYAFPMTIELNWWNKGMVDLKYFLLPGSAVTIAACSSKPQTFVHFYKGIVDRNCLHPTLRPVHSSEYEVDESEDDIISQNSGFYSYGGYCPMPIGSRELPIMDDNDDEHSCLQILPMTFDIKYHDVYTILFGSRNYFPGRNYIKLELMLDRTTYYLNKSIETFQLCSGDTNCYMKMKFGSKETVLVFAPRSSNPGKFVFTIESRCKPRLVMFALFVVVFPLLLFFVATFMYWKRKDEAGDQGNPLMESGHQRRLWADQVDARLVDNGSSNDPPPYETLEDLNPPPYSSLLKS